MEAPAIQHFILTRFNILLWNKAKDGKKVRTKQWLEHRFSLCEKYCLPSLISQTCQDFEWIVLFDSKTPDSFKERIAGYQKECPQLIPVFVEPENGWKFAEIFREQIVRILNSNYNLSDNHNYRVRVLTTYLDNDDALNVRFVEDVQKRASEVGDGTFINYDDGYQYYADDKFLMRVHYPTNHFVSVVESGNPATIKGIFGYGSHSLIEKIKDVKIECVRNQRMWCEVVHEKNVMNDAKFLNARMVSDNDLLKREFAIDDIAKFEFGNYVFKFLPRYARTFVERVKYKLAIRR